MYKALPSELSNKIKEVSTLISPIEKLVELENRYLKGEIRTKEYLRRKRELIREIRQKYGILNQCIKEVEKYTEKEVRLREFLFNLRKLRETWSDYRRIEEKFSLKKITLDEYRSEKERIVVDFQTVISKLKAYI